MSSKPSSLSVSFTDNWTPKYFYIPATCLTVALITTNIIGFKFVELFGIKFGAGTLMFPFCLIIGDLITEVYGFRRSRNVIALSLVCYFVYMVITQVAVALPPAPEWTEQDAFKRVFGQTPRLFLGGACAYIASELTNAYIMSRMKIAHKGKLFSLRAMVSALVAECINTSVYMAVAWGGKMEFAFLAYVVMTGSMLKVGVQTLVLPVTSALASKLKAAEGVDHFDAKF